MPIWEKGIVKVIGQGDSLDEQLGYQNKIGWATGGSRLAGNHVSSG
ncbi:20045_t:CDS:2 [Cetraspora pellucida]|uniref:20045_t:CDS:1 n=1 Tax=Cetraspora pellucida TaxID=1433469 RepID=A0A9N9FAM4_9GLOM|nr:20045_t:CDS:2 [Cetraspora pellucida]